MVFGVLHIGHLYSNASFFCISGNSASLFFISDSILASSKIDNLFPPFILFITQFTQSCHFHIACNVLIIFFGVRTIQAHTKGNIIAGLVNTDTTQPHNNICCIYCCTLDFIAVSTAIQTFNHFISSDIHGIIASNLCNLVLLASLVKFFILLNALSFRVQSVLNQSFLKVFASSNTGQYLLSKADNHSIVFALSSIHLLNDLISDSASLSTQLTFIGFHSQLTKSSIFCLRFNIWSTSNLHSIQASCTIFRASPIAFC
jgi:hypothetical protein